MHEAIVRTATTTLSLIEGQQVHQADDIAINGKPLLIVKGGQSQKLVERVFTEFSKRLDRAGKPFTLSRKLRCICHTDPYGLPVRIPGHQLEAFYLDEWFQYCELVHSAPPQASNSPPLMAGNQQYLKLLDKLPQFVNALISQSRFVTIDLVKLFEVID